MPTLTEALPAVATGVAEVGAGTLFGGEIAAATGVAGVALAAGSIGSKLIDYIP